MALDEKEIFRLIDNIRIPPAPYILEQLHKELQMDEPNLTNISNIISQDTGMSVLVLQTINSPFFGVNVKIRSILHAVNLLGMSFTVNIVAGLSLRLSFEESAGGNLPNHWESPVNVAMVAANVAQIVSFDEPDEMYMLGLFHNVGHALLNQNFSDYKAFYMGSINREGTFITELENKQYNTDHAVLGYFLAKSWKLDSHISYVIRDHHDTINFLKESNGDVSKKGKMLAILKIAEHVDKLFWGMKPDREWGQIEEVVLDYLGISRPDFDDLLADMLEKLNCG